MCNVAAFFFGDGALCTRDLHKPILVSSSCDDDDVLPEALTLRTAAPTVQHPHTASVFAPYYVIIIYNLGLHKLRFYAVHTAVDDTEESVQLGDKENGTG